MHDRQTDAMMTRNVRCEGGVKFYQKCCGPHQIRSVKISDGGAKEQSQDFSVIPCCCFVNCCVTVARIPSIHELGPPTLSAAEFESECDDRRVPTRRAQMQHSLTPLCDMVKPRSAFSNKEHQDGRVGSPDPHIPVWPRAEAASPHAARPDRLSRWP